MKNENRAIIFNTMGELTAVAKFLKRDPDRGVEYMTILEAVERLRLIMKDESNGNT